jgi:hypothetical protein
VSGGVSDHKLNFLKGHLTIKVQYHPRKDLKASNGKNMRIFSGIPMGATPNWEYAKMLSFR